MQLNSVSAYHPAYQLTAPVRATAMTSVSVYTYDKPEYQQPPEGGVPAGSIFDRGTVRLALMSAGTAAVGGTAGYFISKASGLSLRGGAIAGAVVGAALPLALVVWALHRWGK
ncbi:MAG: hypothetical protein CVV27_09995 [Candidatus Melainabacteria bacterium HGW-Melainabacteria-1]|nr:MAG: hypothetical protein CVV27_09995 [Candidatus Melainabacteria bacterium HGW-Melainabacteria-1]